MNIQYNKDINIPNSIWDNVFELLNQRNRTEEELVKLYEFNKNILNEKNIHTESYRYKFAYISALTIANSLKISTNEVEDLVKVRYDFQVEHNIKFERGKIVINKESKSSVTKDKEVKDKSINLAFDTPFLLRGTLE